MKTYTFIFITLLFFCIPKPNALYAQQKGDTDQYTIKVDGLGCPFCAYGLEKKFKEFKEIKDIAIVMETGEFTFTYPASDPLSIATVAAQVEKAGYTPVMVKIVRFDGTVEEQEVKKEN